MQELQQQPDISPYFRSDLAQNQQNCPNCGIVADTEELQKITIRSITRTVHRNEQQQRRLLIQGEGNASPATLMQHGVNDGQMPDDLQAAFSNTDTTWALLPPVLARLKRPPHQLFDVKNKLGDKVVRLCLNCYDQFVDDEEQQLQTAMVNHQSRRQVELEQQGRRARQPINKSVLPMFCERKANRQKDMVFNDNQEQMRENDRELRRKANWRKKFITDQGKGRSDGGDGEEEPIEWGIIPASATVLKEMKHYKATKPAGEKKFKSNKSRIGSARPQTYHGRTTVPAPMSPQRFLQTAIAYHPAIKGNPQQQHQQYQHQQQQHQQLLLLQNAPHGQTPAASGAPGGLDIDWATPQQQLGAGTLGPLVPSELLTPGGDPQHFGSVGGGNFTSEAALFEDLQSGDHKTYFEVTYSQRLCFELHSAMCQATRFGRALLQEEEDMGAEDIMINDPFFTIYRRNQNRLPFPPVSHLVTDAEAVVDGGARDLSAALKEFAGSSSTPVEEGASGDQRADDAATAEGTARSRSGEARRGSTETNGETLSQLMHLLDEDVRYVERSHAFTAKTNRVLLGPGVDEELTGNERSYLQELLAEPQEVDGEGEGGFGGHNFPGGGSGYRGPRDSAMDDEEEEDEEEENIEIDDEESVDFGEVG